MNRFLRGALRHLIPGGCVAGCALIFYQFSPPSAWTFIVVAIIGVTVGQFTFNKLIPGYRKLYTVLLSLLGMLLVAYVNFLPQKAIAAIVFVMSMWAIIVFVAAYCLSCQNSKGNTEASPEEPIVKKNPV